MKPSIDFKKLLPHLLAIGGFLVIISVYFSPVFEGKGLSQHDVMQAQGMGREVQDYHKKTGELAIWTNSMFAGMPAYQIWITYPSNIASHLIKYVKLKLPDPIGYFFLYFAGFYVLLLIFRIKPVIAFIGGVAFAFSSYNLILLEAGHTNKALAIGIMPFVLGGVILVLRKKYITGIALTAIALALQIRANHLQITYYLFIILLVLFIVEFIYAFREKTLVQFFKSVAILLAAAIIAIGVNAGSLWSNYEYSKVTMRGGSELEAKKVDGDGLEKDYALSWSYGRWETMTLLIPGFAGGASLESGSTSSNTYKLLIDKGVPKQTAKNYIKQLPMYWGAMSSTSGPVYFGAVICFLFVFGLFIVKGKLKWWLLGITVMSILLCWGENFMWLTNIFFEYFPMYNKFRVPMTLLVIASVSIPALGLIAVNNILYGEVDKNDVIKALKNSLYVVGGIALVFALFGGTLFDFAAQGDKALEESENSWLLEGITADRARMLRLDALRSLVFILIFSASLYFYLKGKLKLKVLLIISVAAVIIDMWGVGKRYFNEDDFSRKRRGKTVLIKQTNADAEILRDTDPNFKVLNLTLNPWTDATTSYFHKSIGGYHGAKLARYQDLIERHLSPEIQALYSSLQQLNRIDPGKLPVINMLNTKYFILPYQNGNRVLPNPGRCGNAWFVNDYLLVDNPDQEIDTLKGIDPLKTAVIDKRFENIVKDFTFSYDSSAKIDLTEYDPNYLIYKYNSSVDQMVVFSEIYYDKGWKAIIDDKEIPHFRADYILRALIVPKGEHKIEFRFRPDSFYKGEKISMASSVIMMILVLGAIAYPYIKRKRGVVEKDTGKDKE